MSNPDPIRVALVGCGAVAQQYYAPALIELERHQLVRVLALYDPTVANRKELQHYFPNTFCPASVADLSSQQVDLAIIASPPRYHSAQTIQLLNAGLSVLCEKPMATSVAETEAMIEAANQASGLLAIGLFRRFFPASQMIHHILKLNLLGEIRSVSLSEGGTFRWPVQSATYFQKATANGGVLVDIGVHALDLLIWWLGFPDQFVYEDDAIGGIEANCLFRCHFANGSTGEMRLSRDCDLPNRYTIIGTKGWLSWDVHEVNGLHLGFTDAPFGLSAQIHNLNGQSPLPIVGRPASTFEQSFMHQIKNVIAAMRGDEPLLVPAEQAAQSMRLIAECYRRRTLMSMSWLSEIEAARAMELHKVDLEW